MSEPLDALYSTPAMSSIFSPEAHVQAMLAFEAALARAQARAGIIPPAAADLIAASCRVELFDIPTLYAEAASAGTLAIPLVRKLTTLVADDARRYVHWGATSQDAIDTALMLQMRSGLALLSAELLQVCAICARLAEQHRSTLMPGRTLLQQALPITFGLKAARWLSLTARQATFLHQHRQHSLAVQLGGAAGTLASLGNQGSQVVWLLAEELGLPAPPLPWHTERDRVVEIAMAVSITAGSMAKIARDIVLLAQTEVAEAEEGAAPGKGGSSALPQKHNPVDATFALASAQLALGTAPTLLSSLAQEHERAVGGWQAEWAALPSLFRYTSAAVERVRLSLNNLVVSPAHMQANLDVTRGLIMAESLSMALSSHMGKSAAQRLVQSLCGRAMHVNQHLRQIALEDTRVSTLLSPAEITRALDPTAYLGSTDIFIDQSLAAYREIKARVEESGLPPPT